MYGVWDIKWGCFVGREDYRSPRAAQDAAARLDEEPGVVRYQIRKVEAPCTASMT